MRYVLDSASLDSLITGDLAAAAGCIVLIPATASERVASLRSDDFQIELISEQDSSVDDLQVDDEGISWTLTGGPDAHSLIALCEDEGLDHPSDADISAVRTALQQETILVSDDETLRLLMMSFGGQSLPTSEFSAAAHNR